MLGQPDAWDNYVISYYPFAASESVAPGTCPDPHDVMAKQHLILNIGMCGDWAGVSALPRLSPS